MLARFSLLAALSLSLLSADTSVTKLRVEVQSLSGKPIDRAAVIVKFVEGRSVIKLGKKEMTRWELRTNQDGVARLPPIPEGKVRVQVVAKGHQTFGDTFDVEGEEKTITIKLNPPQQQYSAHQ